MALYCRIDLASATVLEGPAELTARLATLPAADLLDLGWHPPKPDEGIAPGFGFWPCVNRPPAFDPATHRVSTDCDLIVDRAARSVTATPLVVPLSLTQVKAAARAAAAAARYELEVGGVTVGGLRISTDRDSQMLISAAAAAARAGAMPAQIPLKHLDGIELIDAAAMIAIGDAVVAHVQAARRREYDVWVLIEAATDVQGVLAAASGDAGRQTPNP